MACGHDGGLRVGFQCFGAGGGHAEVGERERCLAVRLARFLAGSAAAAAFVPVGVMLNLRARLARRGGRA